MRLIDIEPYEKHKDIVTCKVRQRFKGIGFASERYTETRNIPTVDAVEVVHGRWNMILRGNYECSVCGCIPYYAGRIDALNYCPNCGAKMDGGNE